MAIKKKKFLTVVEQEAEDKSAADRKAAYDYWGDSASGPVPVSDIGKGGFLAARRKKLEDAQAAADAAEATRIAELEKDLVDPAATILGGAKFELNPLAAPSFDSASVEEARRKSLLKQRMRGGRASTIMSDKRY